VTQGQVDTATEGSASDEVNISNESTILVDQNSEKTWITLPPLDDGDI